MLFIVIPAYNEEACIEHCVKLWLPIAQKTAGRILVVNDGSKDKTGMILDALAKQNCELQVIHKPNGGHGSAILAGYHHAITNGASYVFQADSDNQCEPEDFWSLWEKREVSPFILANRKYRHDPWIRKVISKFARFFVLGVFGTWPADSNIPFRLMRADVLAEMLLLINPKVLAPNIFLSILAKRAGFETLDIAITHRERNTGEASISGMKIAKFCLRCVQELYRFHQSLKGKNQAMNVLAAVGVGGQQPYSLPRHLSK